MDELILSVIYLIITFVITLLCYKYFGKYGLIIWICVSIIMCNIQTIKISDIFGFSVSLGNVIYGAIYLSTNILIYKYGKKWAKKSTNLSFIIMVIFSLLMVIFLQFEPSSIDTSQKALETIFYFVPRATIASFIAYYIGLMCDIHLFKFLDAKFHNLFISNFVSTITSQIIDTIVFVIISFIGIYTFPDITEIIITMIVIKFLITLCNSPIIFIASKFKKVKEIE